MLSHSHFNVVVVNDFAHVEGGASQVAISSAIGLATQGCEVTFLSAVRPMASAVLDSGIRVVCTDQYAIGEDPKRTRALLQGLWNVRAARFMAQTLEGLDPSRTVVHVHGWTKALSSSVIRAAIVRGFKVICTLHDYFSVCPNGSFFNYPQDKICQLRPLSGACITATCDRRNYGHKVWRVARQYAQNRWGGIPREIRHFIIVSEFSGRILNAFFPRGSNVYEVPNPVTDSYTEPADVRSNSAYVMVGRIAQEKGPHLFAEAARELGSEVMFVGDGDKRSSILKMCPSAEVTGWLSRTEVVNQLRRARALVFPSLWYETDGLAVMEAAAMGIPAIVSDVSAARDSIVDGVTGFLFKAGDAKDLARKMAAMRDDNLVAQMGRAAHAHYWKDPRTMERHIKELEHTYKQVLAC
jgi:glycosyltransferase involved in cell wall biosynthesis